MSDQIKLSLLDHLTDMNPTADVWLIRAGYYEGVAERHTRANRHAQADRLILAAKQMRNLAKQMIKEEKLAKAAAKNVAKVRKARKEATAEARDDRTMPV